MFLSVRGIDWISIILLLVITVPSGKGNVTIEHTQEPDDSGDKVVLDPNPESLKMSNESVVNDTKSGRSVAECFILPEEEGSEASDNRKKYSVQIVNMTHLFQDILWHDASIKSRTTAGNCSMVMYYAGWCPFSAKAAPHFNALPRAFPSLRVAAIDVSTHRSVNSYFGILSVPTVLLFHNGKSLAKFNETSFTVNKFADFISAHTNLKCDENIGVNSIDFLGPLPSVPIKGTDYNVLLAWIFIIFSFVYYIRKTSIWKRMIDLIRTTWREAEDHVHQD